MFYGIKGDSGSTAKFMDLNFLNNDSVLLESNGVVLHRYTQTDSLRTYRPTSGNPFGPYLDVNLFSLETTYRFYEKGPGIFNPTVYSYFYYGVLNCED